ncbi:MAG: hypothetical protein KIT14_01710 [bacterium]|nr:hypothetical protein [bacterium]
MRTLEDLSRAELAAVGREYMLFGHLLNRAALPQVHLQVGAEAREAIAIAEWMGASPVYTRRLQRLLGFAGDDVETIFKGFQLDVGFPHQYMDVGYRVEGPARGVFWLRRCGALLEVEQYGEGAVISMCHHIEDPTFDASAVATNPRARVRPLHRPPRVPADRMPHCEWEVVIDPAAEPIEEIAITRQVGRSRLAAFAFPAVAPDGDGLADYAGAFVPDLRLGAFSRPALVRLCREFLVQDHLLVRSLMIAVAERAGEEMARRIGLAQWIGAGAVAATRLRRVLGAGDAAAGIAAVLALHPAFVPGYSGVDVRGDRLALGDGAALAEGDAWSWPALLAEGPHPALDAMVQAVNPRARCVPTTPAGRERLAWTIVADPAAEAAEPPMEAAMVAATTTAGFAFRSD